MAPFFTLLSIVTKMTLEPVSESFLTAQLTHTRVSGSFRPFRLRVPIRRKVFGHLDCRTVFEVGTEVGVVATHKIPKYRKSETRVCSTSRKQTKHIY